MVCDYTGLNILEIEELDVFEYWLYFRDAVIYNCMQSEDGKEYLEKCWRLEQTKPEREKLREKLNKNKSS